jgi:hypothetical protein
MPQDSFLQRDLNDRLEGIASELTVLELIPYSEEQAVAITAGCKDFTSARFCRALIMPEAKMTDSAQATFLDFSAAQKGTVEFLMQSDGKFQCSVKRSDEAILPPNTELDEIGSLLNKTMQDLFIINSVKFGKPVSISLTAELGTFPTNRGLTLHRDGGRGGHATKAKTLSNLLRIGALPYGHLPEKTYTKATPELRQLIDKACYSMEATDLLWEKNIIEEATLGIFHSLLPASFSRRIKDGINEKGDRHASSPSHMTDLVSSYLRATNFWNNERVWLAPAESLPHRLPSRPLSTVYERYHRIRSDSGMRRSSYTGYVELEI